MDYEETKAQLLACEMRAKWCLKKYEEERERNVKLRKALAWISNSSINSSPAAMREHAAKTLKNIAEW